jgi:hypothetical protein
LREEEKENMRNKLIEIIKNVPAFGIIALPSSFLTLPLLLKVLPKGVFSTGLQD